MKKLLLLLLLLSCKTKENTHFTLSDNYITSYQRINIVEIKPERQYSSKNKKTIYIITVIRSNDTSIVYSRNIFYKGLYWAEVIEDEDHKVIQILSLDEYETVKLN